MGLVEVLEAQTAETDFAALQEMLAAMNSSLKEGVINPSVREAFFTLYHQLLPAMSESMQAAIETELRKITGHKEYKLFFGGCVHYEKSLYDHFSY